MKARIALVLVAISLWAGTATAEDFTVGSIQVHNPWARATPKGAEIGAGYLTITNTGTTTDRLLGGSASVAGHFQVHRMIDDQGVMKMRPVEGGLEIKPGETVELKPGALHIMLIGLKQPLQQGQHVKATLMFEKAGATEIEFAVGSIGAQAPPSAPAGHGDHSGH